MSQKLKELKKQIVERWTNLENHLLESNSFNHLKEKYQSLDVRRQKLLQYTCICFIVLIVAYLPLSYFISSSVYWNEFKEKQEISLEMLKMRNQVASSVFRYSRVQLKNRIEEIVKKYNYTDFKIKAQNSGISGESTMQQVNFEIQLNHLNIKQVIRLGTQLHNLSQARLEAVTMEENKEYPKHYDVTYQLWAFISKPMQEGLIKKPPRLREGLELPNKKRTRKMPKSLSKNPKKLFKQPESLSKNPKPMDLKKLKKPSFQDIKNKRKKPDPNQREQYIKKEPQQYIKKEPQQYIK